MGSFRACRTLRTRQVKTEVQRRDESAEAFSDDPRNDAGWETWILDASNPKGGRILTRWPSRRKQGKVVFKDAKGRPRTVKGRIELVRGFVKVTRGGKVHYIQKDRVMTVENQK